MILYCGNRFAWACPQMTGFSRYQSLLRLFTADQPAWSVPAMAERLGAPASSVYRTVRELTAAGFLEPSSAASYRLGAAFIEYDRLLRLTDPLVRAGLPVLRDVVGEAHLPCVALLARLYNEEVMCVADERAPGTSFTSSYERGRPMPLTKGATSKAILASVAPRQLNRLVGPREESAALRDELSGVRKAGYCYATAEIDVGLAGIAAPIAVPERGVIASLTLVLQAEDLDDARRRRLALLAMSAAGLIVEAITRD